MNPNIRGKRKNIEKALQSIQLSQHPSNNPKVLTENSEPYCIQRQSERKITIPVGNDDKGMRMLRRYRYKQSKDQQGDVAMNKYKSLELAKRSLKRTSQRHLNQYNSIQNSPYKVLQPRKSAQRIAPNQESFTKPAIGKVGSKDNKKFSIPKKMSIPKIKQCHLEEEQVWAIKENAKAQIKLNQFQIALRNLERIVEGSQTDIELLDLKGTCLMNLKRFEDALINFSRILLLDKFYSKKVYISLALCENQLNHADRCIFHIDQCISLFPEYYEAYYFKGKLYYKQKLYDFAIEMLVEASRLNPNKKEIKQLIAECYELKGDFDEALLYYQISASQVNEKNIKSCVKYGTLLIKHSRQSEGISVLEKCLEIVDKSTALQAEKVQVNYYLTLAYYRKKNYTMCSMRGEQILNSSCCQYIPSIIKILMTCKIIEHNYYGTIYFLRRLDFFKESKEELRIYIEFCEGVMLLMKKKVDQGIKKLVKLGELLQNTPADQFNQQISKNYRLFIIYAYFIQGKNAECLNGIKQQKTIGVDPYFENSVSYVEKICGTIIKYNNKEYFEAEKDLNNCLQRFPDKAETNLYLALLHFKLYFLHQAKQKCEESKATIFFNLTRCTQAFGSISSNFSAYIFYYRALAYAWDGQWALSICDLDIAMQKSQDNFFNFYYLRAIVLANLQNYKQAVSDVSIALSMNEDSASAYLLRAKCLQIDGNPSQAFADLQTFIALRPQDKQIHKFAGHLLFENGAFEDALAAYSQGEISEMDFEVYLTRSKTYFLLGNFTKSAEDMLAASKLVADSSEIKFDHTIIKWLAKLFQKSPVMLSITQKDKNEDGYEFEKLHLKSCLNQLKGFYQEQANSGIKYGKIFKLSEFLTLSAMCNFYLQDYQQAIDKFIEAIELKQISLQGQEEGQFQQEEVEKIVFINQMYFNLALCCNMLQDYPNSQRYLRKCQISPQLHNYDIYLQLLDQIKGISPVDQNEVYMDLFSLRNKLSKYLPKIRVPFLFKEDDSFNYRQMKLCIPYPKVEPPEINPSFDERLIMEIDINQVQRRADAPWIYRQKDSIKFTDRIDVYSRFEMQKSQVDDKKHHMESHISSSSLQMSQTNIRDHLKLDAKLQEKLNKLLKKQK